MCVAERVTSAGIVFITADYRLIPPSTGHEIVEDIKDLFCHLASSDFNDQVRKHFERENVRTSSETATFVIDPARLAVAGNSAGGLCAYLAVMHATPKPRAIVALYAMGGNFLVLWCSQLAAQNNSSSLLNRHPTT